MLIAFWICLGLLMYSYVGYPCLLALVSLFVRRSRSWDDDFSPTVALIIPAHNEAEVIEEKIRNSLELDYPRDRMTIMVASDASSDRTVEIARRFEDDGVLVESSGTRKGKMGVLNGTVSKVDADILVLTDANAMFSRDAIRKLVRHFVDPLVGCVCGAKRVSSGRSDIGGTEGLYWKYENVLKILEGRVGSCVGADGSIYALRRELYPFPREDRIIMDDLAVSLRVIQKGYRVVFEKEAFAAEGASVDVWDEFKRKVRILAGALVAVTYAGKLLIPFGSSVWFQLYSHKLIRWAGGFLMLGTLLTNMFLTGYVYRTLLFLQLLFYTMALVGFALQLNGRKSGKLHLPFYFVMTNIAQIAGLARYVIGRDKPAWERLEREAA